MQQHHFKYCLNNALECGDIKAIHKVIGISQDLWREREGLSDLEEPERNSINDSSRDFVVEGIFPELFTATAPGNHFFSVPFSEFKEE